MTKWQQLFIGHKSNDFNEFSSKLCGGVIHHPITSWDKKNLILKYEDAVIQFDLFDFNPKYDEISTSDGGTLYTSGFCDKILLDDNAGNYFFIPPSIVYDIYDVSDNYKIKLLNAPELLKTGSFGDVTSYKVNDMRFNITTKNIGYFELTDPRHPLQFYKNGHYTYIFSGFKLIGKIREEDKILQIPKVLDTVESNPIRLECDKVIEETSIITDSKTIFIHMNNGMAVVKREDINEEGVHRFSFMINGEYLYRDAKVRNNFYYKDYLFFSMSDYTFYMCIPRKDINVRG